MLRDIIRLTGKEDVLPQIIAALVSVLIAGVLIALVKSPAAKIAVYVVFGGIVLGAFLSAGLKLRFRYCELCKGHCPNPLCHGVVQHSDRVAKNFVVCPTCRKVWPEITNIQFKATSRQW